MEMLNYATKAITYFQNLALTIVQSRRRDLAPDLLALRWLCEALEESIKFRLPDGGRLFGRDAMADVDSANKITEMFRLPFPVTLIEYFVPEGSEDIVPGNHEAPKRICLAIDLNAPILDRFPGNDPREVVTSHGEEHGALVLSFYSDGEDWSAPAVALFFPYQTEIMRAPTVLEQSSKIVPDAPVSDTIVATVLPHFMAALAQQHGKDKAMENSIADAVDEVNALFQFCSVINCANVGNSKVLASTALNKKRIKNNKVPFFDYHVLELAPQAAGPKGAGGGGLGSTKRMHLRRGHIRRVGEGEKQRRIWVNAAVVGAVNKGAVIKDYAVKAA